MNGDSVIPPNRICLVLHKFSRGGSDRVAAHLARGFTDRGIPVDMLVFGRGGEVEAILVGLIGDDIPIHFLGQQSGSRPLDLIRGLPSLVRFLRRTTPDAIVSTANNTSLVTAIATRLAGLSEAKLFLKTTNPIASSRHRGLARRLRLWSYRAIFRWTDGCWTLSPEESREMVAAFPEYEAIFRDVANPYVTSRMLERIGAPRSSGGKTILTIARLTPQKRLERLVRGFHALPDPSARLVILGEGELRGELSGLIEHLGLTGRVTMPGYVADVAPHLHGADLFVLTSDYEGLPAAALEAMAANCPVLSTDCFPCARDLLETAEGCGIIEDASPGALAAIMDAHLRLPRPRSLTDIAARYSIEAGVESHLRAMEAAARGR